MEHHDKFPPSSFPGFAQCAQYKSGKPSEAATRGSMQHEYLEAMLKEEKKRAEELSEPLTDNEIDNVQWAATYIRNHSSAKREIETKLHLIDQNFNDITFGHMDVLDKSEEFACSLFDYKSGQKHDYYHQMLVYARMAMDKHNVKLCHVHEVYGELRYVNKYNITFAETEVIFDIINRIEAGEPARLCDRCGWCVNLESCPAVQSHVKNAVTTYNQRKEIDASLAEALADYDPANIEDPVQMSKARIIAKVLEKWCKSVDAHSRKMAVEDGMELPDFEVKCGETESLDKDDIRSAFDASGLDVNIFLGCCTLGVTALRKAIAESIGMKTPNGKKAKEEFSKRMGALITKKPRKTLERKAG